MKRFSISILFALSVGSVSHAGTSIFDNTGTVTQLTNIVANVFIQQGLFDLYPTITNSTFLSDPAHDPFTTQIFTTHGTEYWTNAANGIMMGQPGFGFYALTSTGQHPSTAFNDAGLIQSFDVPIEGFEYFGTGGAVAVELYPSQVVGPGINGTVPGTTVVSATNITISGTMQVGDLGLLQLSGQNVQLNSGTFIAGTLSEDPTDPEATMDRGLQGAYLLAGAYWPAFGPPADVYDLFWGATNASSFTGNVEDLSDTFLSPTEVELEQEDPRILGTRNGNIEGVQINQSGIVGGIPSLFIFPLSGNVDPLNGVTFPAGNFVPYVQEYSISANPTTNYISIVLVNQAFADTNISVQVGLLPEAGLNVLTNNDPNGFEYMVKFSTPVLDVVSGETVTNSIYLIDSGAVETTAQGSTNATYLFDAKPTTMEITRNEPLEWEVWLEEQSIYPFILGLDPATIESLIYTGGETQNATTPITDVVYGAQIGRNPERMDGLFPFGADLIGTVNYDMPAQSNEPARVEINAQKLDLTGMTLRGNGAVKLFAPTVTGSPAGMDFGNYTADLGNTKSVTIVSNIFPANFDRLRGDILAWSANWQNIITNDGTSPARITNYVHYHMLVVDQDLRSTFKPSALNVALRGSSVVVDDPVNVIGGAYIQATNLILNAALNMSGNTPELLTSNMPSVKSLVIGPKGSMSADEDINLNVPLQLGSVNPSTTTYKMTTLSNLNNISSGTIQMQSQLFAEGGTVQAGNRGLILINSKTNLLGAGIGWTNLLKADGDINLYSVVIQATNSTIVAGAGGLGQLTIYASGQLTDFYPSAASTNSYMTNIWQTTAGFSLPVKPTSGDLFGTQIKTIAAKPNQVSRHFWSAQNTGPSAAGFFNNAVIGHLVIDRTSSSATLRFSGTGAKNAMYVDFLDLEDLAFSDYHHGLVVDPNLTIYFANANVDPSKLSATYSNIVWVPQFAGPNSTTVVHYKNGGVCLMNAALASSPDISSDFSGIPNSKNPFPLDNPSAYVGAIACPSSVTSAELINLTNNGVSQILAIWTTGEGSITPSLKTAKVGQTLVLTAVPAPGWSFLSWSGGMSASSPTISFVIPATNAVLTANFVVNPLPTLAGTYNGLFYQTAGLTASSSGFATFSVSSTGAASGKLTIGSISYPFTAQFYGSGLATVRATNGTNVLTVTLQLDAANLSDQATGQVANGTWEAALVADRAPVWTTAKPSPQAGYYTAVLPGNANAATSPGGDSYGTITVSALGTLSAVGSLADGTGVTFSQSVPVSKEGQWPLYFAASGGQTLIGWVSFIANGLAGNVNWIKTAGSPPYYTNGFSTSSLLLGDKYVAPTGQSSGLHFTNATVSLNGGNLAAGVVSLVSVNGGVTWQTADKTTLTLTVTPKTGGFTGQYFPGGAAQKTVISGVVLPNEQVARGFFLGTNQSGSVLLESR